MDDYLKSAVQYVFGGSVAGAVAMAALWVLRKLWRGDQIASADATGNITAVDRLLRILDERQEENAALRAALVEASARVDKAYQDRNDMLRELGEVKAELAALKAEFRLSRGQNVQTT